MEKSVQFSIYLDKFRLNEIQSLYSVYKSYLPSNLPISPLNIQQYMLDKIPFKTLLMTHYGFVDTLILDRIFKFFDCNNDNKITFDEFVKGMFILASQDVHQQALFSFYIYDLNGDKFITKEEMMQLLNRHEEDDEMDRELIEIALKKLDEDKDGKISEADWITSVGREPLLLQALGKCLPSMFQLDKVLNYPSEPWMSKISGLVDAIEKQ